MTYHFRLSFILFNTLMVVQSISYANQTLNDCQRLSDVRLPHSSQIIVVKSLGGFKANMTLCQQHDGLWRSVYKAPFKVVLGKKGITLASQKKEGDLKTPAGLYPIGEAFGTHPLALKMDYKYITVEDKFVDDIHHKNYNSWVFGATDAKSYESMLIDPYAYGAVVNYNMNPTKKGSGSAIFIHLWRSPNIPTSGCIALDKKHLLMMLYWLDKSQHPYIYVLEHEF